jgi:hypothetical protein
MELGECSKLNALSLIFEIWVYKKSMLLVNLGDMKNVIVFLGMKFLRKRFGKECLGGNEKRRKNEFLRWKFK